MIRTASCWRRARFSKARSERSLRALGVNENSRKMVRIMTESAWLGSWNVNGFNAAGVLAKYRLSPENVFFRPLRRMGGCCLSARARRGVAQRQGTSEPFYRWPQTVAGAERWLRGALQRPQKGQYRTKQAMEVATAGVNNVISLGHLKDFLK